MRKDSHTTTENTTGCFTWNKNSGKFGGVNVPRGTAGRLLSCLRCVSYNYSTLRGPVKKTGPWSERIWLSPCMATLSSSSRVVLSLSKDVSKDGRLAPPPHTGVKFAHRYAAPPLLRVRRSGGKLRWREILRARAANVPQKFIGGLIQQPLQGALPQATQP